MFKNITIGQYFPSNSFIHRSDPRFKIIIMLIYVIMIFFITSLVAFILPLSFIVFSYIFSKVPLKLIFKSLKSILPLIFFTAVLNILFVTGEVIYKFHFIEITKEGIIFSALMVIRIICIISSTSLLTYTTSPIEFTDALESLFSPLKKLKVPVHEFSMMMTIALRFIPTLMEETEKIINAQKSRGSDIDTGGLISKVKAMIPILVPLFISSFKRADDLALAMECRCYRGGEGRTKMKKLKVSFKDYLLLIITVFFIVLSLLINYNVGGTY